VLHYYLIQMIITILAEYRSGSTNLAKWFDLNSNFTVLVEALNPYGIGNRRQIHNIIKSDKNPKTWVYPTTHLLVKEIYDKRIPYLNDLIQVSDKIIVLYRENLEVQLESFINGSITNKWDAKWMYKFIDDANIDKKTQLLIDNFFDVKNDIKKDLIESEKYFTISYEELYFNNGFQKLVDYINLEEVQNINFPFGEKYRIDFDKNKFI